MNTKMIRQLTGDRRRKNGFHLPWAAISYYRCLKIIKDAKPKDMYREKTLFQRIRLLGPDNILPKQIEKNLRTKKECNISSKLFHSHLSDVKEKLKIVADAEVIDFKKSKKKLSPIMTWIHDNGIKDVSNNYITSNMDKTNFVLANISSYKDRWHGSKNLRGAFMKVYNSFSYTEDIKYEARILELPMQDGDFKTVIIVPNEEDVLLSLFNKLNSEGLTAATKSIQPLFTTVCELDAPSIEFSSHVQESQLCLDNGLRVTTTEFGDVKINEQGVSITVFSCISSENHTPLPTTPDSGKSQKPFYFAIVFKDTPIFTGNYF